MGKPQQATPDKRRSYSEEFKREAVRVIVEEKYSFRAASAAVGVSQQSPRGWHAKYAPPPARRWTRSSAPRRFAILRPHIVRNVRWLASARLANAPARAVTFIIDGPEIQ